MFFAYFRQVRDLLLERLTWFQLAALGTLTVAVWAVPIYLSSMQALIKNAENLRLPKFPVLLGLMPFGVTILGVYLAYIDITICQSIRTVDRLNECFGTPYLQEKLIVEEMKSGSAITSSSSSEVISGSLDQFARAALAQLGYDSVTLFGAALIFLLFVSGSKVRVSNYFSDKSPALHFQFVPFVLSGGLLLWAFYWPLEFTDQFGRATLLPVLLGAWVALVTVVSFYCDRLATSIIAVAVFVVIILSAVKPGFHDVELYTSRYWTAAQGVGEDHKIHPGSAERQLYLEDAISTWMIANNCKGDGLACPPIVLVAAEGGASRSAFFSATVLGALLDKTRENNRDYPDFGSLLFAMSGVSGGALGVATTRTALADATSMKPPCKLVQSLWFGDPGIIGSQQRREITQSWRACLQLLTAGDYLSPTIVGLSLRDNLAALVSSDRATLLEEAIERHYNSIVFGERTACQGENDLRGLCRPFGYLPNLNRTRWMPILLLNATAVDSGKPIIASDVYTAVASCVQRDCKPLFSAAHNVFELFKDPRTPPEIKPDTLESVLVTGLQDAEDLRVSSAVVLSARFPLISPAGVLRYVHEGTSLATASVVDGGYFDNSGLESIAHLIPFLTAKKLRPLVIYIANDPWTSTRYERPGHSFLVQDADRLWETQLKPVNESFWSRALAFLADPLKTLNKTRSGHVEAAKERLLRLKENDEIKFETFRVMNPLTPMRGKPHDWSLCMDNPDSAPIGRISVYQPVMSWWLSHLSQRALDAQLCDFENAMTIRRILQALRPGRKGS
jgi:hypothetical protein